MNFQHGETAGAIPERENSGRLDRAPQMEMRSLGCEVNYAS